MKVEVNECKNEKENKYPCLMISESGTIIIAIKSDENNIEGVILKDNPPLQKGLGYYSKTFTKSCFRPFNGTITLSNDQ